MHDREGRLLLRQVSLPDDFPDHGFHKLRQAPASPAAGGAARGQVRQQTGAFSAPSDQGVDLPSRQAQLFGRAVRRPVGDRGHGRQRRNDHVLPA
ncbi:hypothetical protein [Arthrobacter crystallopoietes]|uniref:hypothetical protein n=1 Tax=Crystallibacter crystallopoietes TaxID=37928 RepID=UPI003CC7A378